MQGLSSSYSSGFDAKWISGQGSPRRREGHEDARRRFGPQTPRHRAGNASHAAASRRPGHADGRKRKHQVRSVCVSVRPSARTAGRLRRPACDVARLAACAPDLRVSVSPWQNPWTRSQRDIVADFARFSAGFAVSAFDVLLCVSVSPWQNPWTRPQRDIVARFGRFVFVPPRPAFVPRLAATKHYNRRPSVRVP